MITKAIKKAFSLKEKRGWEKTYWAIDIHETVVKPNWKNKEITTEFYPLAKEALQKLSARDDVVRILYTCSHPEEISEYLSYFRSHDIHFDYVNENPEVANSGYGCYDQKPYFNVLLEDKSGFDAYEDWPKVMEGLEMYG